MNKHLEAADSLCEVRHLAARYRTVLIEKGLAVTWDVKVERNAKSKASGGGWRIVLVKKGGV